MKGGWPALLLLLATQAGAQSFISMGRLFTTPAERAQLDAQRNQALVVTPGIPGGPGGQGTAGIPGVPASPGGFPSPSAQGAAGEAAFGAGAGDAGVPGGARGAGAGGAGEAGSAGAAGGGALGGAVAEGEAAPGLRLDGVVRRSNGRDMIIVNGEVRPAPARGILRGTVRLQADGRSVTLKPGQHYDPATGVIHEAAR